MIELGNLEKMPELLKPRRIMKYLIVWCSSGSVTIEVDESEFDLKSNEIITITSGQIHCILKTKNTEGLVLQFTYDFFCKDDNDIELIFHNSLFCHFAMNEVISLPDNKVEMELKKIGVELRNRPFQFLMAVHSRLKLILIEINRAKLSTGAEVYKPDALFLKFLERVKEQFHQKLSVRQIANSLGTTESKLNELSKLHTGKTAQNVIYGLVASEAKRLFAYEKLSVKEVAYKLGFSDPFYFSTFFKKQTMYSPKAYKERFAV